VTGYFITFEGIDGSGKTAQAELLQKRLKEKLIPVVCFRDPGATAISERIRDILLDKGNILMSPWTELLLYESARAQMVEENINPALRENKIVICDRFFDSTTAYQGYGRQLDLETVALANRIGSCGLTPNMTFLIDVDVEIALHRRQKINEKSDRLESENIDFHERVRQGYLTIAGQEPDRVKIVKGNRTIDEVAEEIWNLVNQHVGLDKVNR